MNKKIVSDEEIEKIIQKNTKLDYFGMTAILLLLISLVFLPISLLIIKIFYLYTILSNLWNLYIVVALIFIIARLLLYNKNYKKDNIKVEIGAISSIPDLSEQLVEITINDKKYRLAEKRIFNLSGIVVGDMVYVVTMNNKANYAYRYNDYYYQGTYLINNNNLYNTPYMDNQVISKNILTDNIIKRDINKGNLTTTGIMIFLVMVVGSFIGYCLNISGDELEMFVFGLLFIFCIMYSIIKRRLPSKEWYIIDSNVKVSQYKENGLSFVSLHNIEGEIPIKNQIFKTDDPVYAIIEKKSNKLLYCYNKNNYDYKKE